MEKFRLFSRRPGATVDFRPDVDEKSPSAQLRRLSVYLGHNTTTDADITDCPDGIQFLREYTYRKIFGGTSHSDFIELDATDPKAIDWLIAVHEAETDAHKNARK